MPAVTLIQYLGSPEVVIGYATSLALAVLIVLTQGWHGRLSMDHTVGVQKFHTHPTPRVGGVAIFGGLIVLWATTPGEQVGFKPLLGNLLLAGSLAFAFGLMEDITKRVSVAHRLLATMASGVVAWWLTGYALLDVDVVGLNALLQWTPLAVAFTAFAVGGVANAINIIDGFNGLASSTSIIAFLGYGLVAAQVGDAEVTHLCMAMSAVVSGFFLINWPMGKLFLGDGGSYFIGFNLAWVCVMLLQRHEAINAFAMLLVCLHPVTEVLFSVFRRRVRKEHPGHPDRLHFHSLVHRRYVRRWFSRCTPRLQNSITGLLVGSMSLTAVLGTCLTYDSLPLALVTWLALVLSYIAMYARMVSFHWCSPVPMLLHRPANAVLQARLVR